jgi:hypothetical protein
LQVCNFPSFRNYRHFLTSLRTRAQRPPGALLLGRVAQRTPIRCVAHPSFRFSCPDAVMIRSGPSINGLQKCMWRMAQPFMARPKVREGVRCIASLQNSEFPNYGHFLTSLRTRAQRPPGALLLGKVAQRTPYLTRGAPVFSTLLTPPWYNLFWSTPGQFPRTRAAHRAPIFGPNSELEIGCAALQVCNFPIFRF